MTNLISPTVGGVLPAFFADFTTEGTTNHYYFNGAFPVNFAAFLTAISGTFARSSTAYYTNSSGILTQAGSGVIRFDYDPVSLNPKGILREGASTNLALQSNSFSNAAWTANAATIGSTTASPDGGNNAAKIQEDNTTNFHFVLQNVDSGTVPASTVFTHSFYAKAAERSSAAFRIASNGVLCSAIFTLSGAGSFQIIDNANSISPSISLGPNGFYRCVITYTSPGGSAGEFMEFGPSDGAHLSYAGTAGNGIFAYGAQAEILGSASSYIPTTSATVTRAADSLTATPISWYNSTNGVFYCAADTILPFGNGPGVIGVDDGTSNNFIALTAANSGENLGISSGGVAQQINASVPILANTLFREAGSFSAGSNNIVYTHDGGAAQTATSAMPVSPTNLILGLFAGFRNNDLFGHINQIGYWPTVATGLQLQTLTGSAPVFAVQNINTVSTQNLNLPINCALGGSQTEEIPRKFSVDMFGILKRIFRE